MNFTEQQKFNQWWLWLLLTFLIIFPLVGMYHQLIEGQSFGNKPMSDTGLIIASLVMLALVALFYTTKLTTEINQHEIVMRFFPFVTKRTKWQDIKNAQVINYGFVGGWGIRLWTSYGTVYNIRGNKGLAIELKNGKKFLIGTQKEEELRAYLEKIERSGKEQQ